MQTVTLKKTVVDEIVAAASESWEWIDNLYRHVFESAGVDYDAITRIDGYITIANDGNLYITEKAIEFDQEKHPKVVAGGAWSLGCGFSTDYDLKSFKNGGWEVALPQYVI